MQCMDCFGSCNRVGDCLDRATNPTESISMSSSRYRMEERKKDQHQALHEGLPRDKPRSKPEESSWNRILSVMEREEKKRKEKKREEKEKEKDKGGGIGIGRVLRGINDDTIKG